MWNVYANSTRGRNDRLRAREPEEAAPARMGMPEVRPCPRSVGFVVFVRPGADVEAPASGSLRLMPEVDPRIEVVAKALCAHDQTLDGRPWELVSETMHAEYRTEAAFVVAALDAWEREARRDRERALIRAAIIEYDRRRCDDSEYPTEQQCEDAIRDSISVVLREET